ncbi:type 1 glutamine amidotransferase domain-containing protein [Maribacter polysiphoniae]|uniref:Putative intracellular protease/amidase n=1 Tax=Maribacter polysiphoniae TaxID=429344 RepID=A0A316DYH8_9FLAO|nr:type 1 glutamine amidotransferase domain-containing protein [Maribacter polysiphoniae]MBD1262158.1 type 1 glutamine amidotransferase domain-containing protein [Maribacter polysiphoniae]PWK21583.1 putative intracellular protease/amidase [Maribacter polysiphoniae]
MEILIVLTSHALLGNTGEKTGFWIEEFATPYYYLIDNDVNVTLASPEGGQPPIDPTSDKPENQTESTKRFKNDEALLDRLSKTLKLSEVSTKEYDAVFYPGGHGPLWDLAESEVSARLIESFYNANKPVAFVCHAPAALKNVKNISGEPLVKGKKVTGFTNSEEELVGLTDVVPFLVEDMLKEKGGIYSKSNDFEAYALEDGLLITGQNPASSQKVAELLLTKLEPKK